jgi:hypothetical protein
MDVDEEIDYKEGSPIDESGSEEGMDEVLERNTLGCYLSMD